MAFPRYVHGLWSAVADKINAIGDYFETLCATVIGRVTNSITTDEDGKAQLVNDLADDEIIPNLTYGVDENGVRGFKPDTGHIQGTDQGLDTGGANAVVVADIKDAVTKKHDIATAGVGISITGQVITNTGSMSGNVDGGFANSIYLISQNLDGGGA